MTGKRTYVLSIHEPEGNLILEDVRTRRLVRLTDLSEIAEQIASWREQDPPPEPAGDESAP